MPTGHSCMLAPLKADGKVIGLMTLDHRQCEVFSPERIKWRELFPDSLP
jgi:transcriptional regulator with GAF, ATPase, and Fis domain